jgi:hypothetical protein
LCEIELLHGDRSNRHVLVSGIVPNTTFNF